VKQVSVGTLKNMGRKPQDRPDPSSRIGKFLAALMSGNKVAASVFFGRTGTEAVEYLRSRYGMEIESKGGKGGGCRLLGEWDGPYFVPIERMDPYPPLPED
jgi:hypothetical protein